MAALVAVTPSTAIYAQPIGQGAGPGTKSRRPSRRWKRPVSTAPQSVEFKQFQALLQYPDSGPEFDGRRRSALVELGVPEDLTSSASVRRGAQRYVRQRWRALREARMRDAGLPTKLELIKAWYAHAREETRLQADAIERIGLKLEDVRPPPRGPSRVRAELRKSPPSAEALLRALLIGTDGELADEIVRYAGKLEPIAPPSVSAHRRYPHWEWVCLSPDPAILPPLLKFACRAEALEQVESSHFWMFRMVGERSLSLSEPRMRELLGCVDERAFAAALEKFGGGLEHSMPFLKGLIFDLQLRPGVQSALIRCFARKPDVLETVLNSDNASWREAVLRACLRPGVGPRLKLLDLEQWAVAENASPVARELAVKLLGKRRRSPRASARPARKSLRRLTEADDPVLRQLAVDMMAEIEKWDAETAKRDDRRRALALAENARIREELAAAARGEIDLDPAVRAYLDLLISEPKGPSASRGLRYLWDALKEFGSDNNGSWPESLASLDEYLPRDRGSACLYFPLRSVPIDRSNRHVILAVVAEQSSDPRTQVFPVLFANGRINNASASEFPGLWEASNAARAALGEAEIPASALGDLADWAEEGARTEP